MEQENETMTGQETDLDALWDEDAANQPADQQAGENAEQEDPQEGGETRSTDQPADQQAGQEAGGEAPKEGEEQPGKPEELFTLKNREEVRQVNRQELIAMAQKGWDYDAVRQERDELREYRQGTEAALQAVKAYAERSGMTVEQYLDYCREQELVAGGMSRETAQAQLAVEKRQAALDAREAREAADKKARETQEQIERERAQAREKEFDAFMAAYPDVKAADIPKEVWAAVAKGESLTTAYTMHVNEALKAKLAAQQQNEKNAARSPGSMTSRGESGRKSIDEIWDEAGE